MNQLVIWLSVTEEGGILVVLYNFETIGKYV
jgi:hypothetical protein